MDAEFFKNIFLKNFGFQPTSDQMSAIDNLCRYVFESQEESIFLLCGYAGTGKTSLISSFVKTLSGFRVKTRLMAPTGRAAKVFSGFSSHRALTIHKSIYRQKSGIDGVFQLDRNLNSDTFFIVDEASMISSGGGEFSVFGSGRLLDDLIHYVFSGHNCRLILIGDTAQLPPVGSTLSPALDKRELECYGKTVFYSSLSEVLRQSSESGILFNATLLRQQIQESFSGEILKPKFQLKKFPDIERISGGDLLEKLETSYDRNGIFDTLVITRSNKNANIYNNGIRSRIFYREESVTVGDLLMVVKNNYFYAKGLENMDFIANGDFAEVIRVGKEQSLYGFHFLNLDLRFNDLDGLEISVKIIKESLASESASLSEKESNALYQAVLEDYTGMSKKDIYKEMRENEYFNALQVKFAYAVTCHKSQGGQWKNVFIDQGYLTDEMLDREYLRWLYTALTRATEKIYLVNFREDFFEN
ncbi:MAG: ATP-binding domain-containing protein [Bacteroidales bacterium]|nr:ATP-binding domain-containing protein [Bacteroidales bacterium]